MLMLVFFLITSPGSLPRSTCGKAWRKSLVFGAIFSSVGCYCGFYAQGGAKGVGKSDNTRSSYLFGRDFGGMDFFISWLQLQGNSPSIN